MRFIPEKWPYLKYNTGQNTGCRHRCHTVTHNTHRPQHGLSFASRCSIAVRFLATRVRLTFSNRLWPINVFHVCHARAEPFALQALKGYKRAWLQLGCPFFCYTICVRVGENPARGETFIFCTRRCSKNYRLFKFLSFLFSKIRLSAYIKRQC